MPIFTSEKNSGTVSPNYFCLLWRWFLFCLHAMAILDFLPRHSERANKKWCSHQCSVIIQKEVVPSTGDALTRPMVMLPTPQRRVLSLSLLLLPRSWAKPSTLFTAWWSWHRVRARVAVRTCYSSHTRVSGRKSWACLSRRSPHPWGAMSWSSKVPDPHM